MNDIYRTSANISVDIRYVQVFTNLNYAVHKKFTFLMGCFMPLYISKNTDTITNHQRILCNGQSYTIVQPESFMTERRMLLILILTITLCQH